VFAAASGTNGLKDRNLIGYMYETMELPCVKCSSNIAAWQMVMIDSRLNRIVSFPTGEV
jgi:hypothetical protein